MLEEFRVVLLDPLTIIAAVGAAGSLVGGLHNAFGSNRTAAPTITPPPVPSGPAPDLSPSDISSRRPATTPTPPSWLGLSPDMTPLQQRATIATRATSGNDSRYSDTATRDYYRDLLLSQYNNGSLPGGVLPQEYQAAQRWGYAPRQQTAESLISAILRG